MSLSVDQQANQIAPYPRNLEETIPALDDTGNVTFFELKNGVADSGYESAQALDSAQPPQSPNIGGLQALNPPQYWGARGAKSYRY
ncbi:MAG: hypothetical protein ACFBSF_07245, partial [Leptolyngbyaceae cyanobacterium]